MAFGWYLARSAGPKSLKKLARAPLEPACLMMSDEPEVGPGLSSEKVNIGEPWPKKKAGILDGFSGSASKALRHSSRVLGKEPAMGAVTVTDEVEKRRNMFHARTTDRKVRR